MWFARKSGQVDIANIFIDAGPQGHVVVAIDIGTTFSSYAMSFSRDKFNIYVMSAVDHFRRPIQTKVPTVLLLKPDLTFHSFGQEALTFFIDLEEVEQKKWHFFERFKMSLHSKQVKGDIF